MGLDLLRDLLIETPGLKNQGHPTECEDAADLHTGRTLETSVVRDPCPDGDEAGELRQYRHDAKIVGRQTAELRLGVPVIFSAAAVVECDAPGDGVEHALSMVIQRLKTSATG